MTVVPDTDVLTRERLGELLGENASPIRQGQIWKVLVTTRALNPYCSRCSTLLYEEGARGPRFECRHHNTTFRYETIVFEIDTILSHKGEILRSPKVGQQTEMILEDLFRRLEDDKS